MKKLTVGIVAATKEEYHHLFNNLGPQLFELQVYKKDKSNPFNTFIGKYYLNINPNDDEKIEVLVITIESGFGCINASCAATLIYERYKIDFLINFGAAGALKDTLKIGDIVLLKYVYQSSYISFIANNNSQYNGNITIGLNEKEKFINKNLISNFNFLRQVNGCSSEMDIDSSEKRCFLKKYFNADICDWESFSIRKIAHILRIPSLIIRVISDFADEKFLQDYKSNLDVILDRAAKIFCNEILIFSCKILVLNFNF